MVNGKLLLIGDIEHFRRTSPRTKSELKGISTGLTKKTKVKAKNVFNERV